MRQSIAVLLFTSLLTLLAGCGQTGPLYLSNTDSLSKEPNASDKPVSTETNTAPQAKEGQ